ncbi:MAG: GspE/PulE family protein [Pseudanabaenaceae cyanobacterium bins.68]|nr:GspE/PulE family protein [Pseudanabaenaceae cyanobacterium bins.68]
MTTSDSAWQQLKRREISLETALNLLIDTRGNLALDLIDKELASQFQRQVGSHDFHVVPLLLWQGKYYLASPTPLNSQELKTISDRTHTSVETIAIAKKSYRDWLRQKSLNLEVISDEVLSTPFDDDIEPEDISELAGAELSKASDQRSRINVIISNALRSRASDIHLEPDVDGLRLRYRIDGVLRDIAKLPIEFSRKVIVSTKVMCDMDISESRRPQDGRIGRNYSSKDATEKLDMRVSTLPCMGGEKIVIRLLPQNNPFNEVKDLGFTPRTLGIYQSWLNQPQGLIIFTGPTGSGKTSTLYTSLQKVSTERVNVVTVEDPVEYILPHITQTQVNELAGMTFAAGLRAILRQDPDIIMVGEIRDPETAETAVRAALTGHLVLTTMHTNDAAGAIPRLRDIGPDPGLICDALLGVVAQRLVRKICPHCAQPYTPAEAELQLLGLKQGDTDLSNWRRGAGCAKCLNSGYLGREAVVELLEVNDRVRQIIYEGSMVEMQKYLSQADFNSFRLAAIDKVSRGVTTVEELRRVLPYSALHSRF